VVALVLGIVFRDEIVAPMAIVGSLLVIVGAILASRRENRATPTTAALVEEDAA
jgi:drug/metabolite transporter (DMT)-like permease